MPDVKLKIFPFVKLMVCMHIDSCFINALSNFDSNNSDSSSLISFLGEVIPNTYQWCEQGWNIVFSLIQHVHVILPQD